MKRQERMETNFLNNYTSKALNQFGLIIVNYNNKKVSVGRGCLHGGYRYEWNLT